MSEAKEKSVVPRIHFIALVSVDLDVDMLPTFLPAYNDLDLDNYCLFLHEGKNTDANLWAEKAAKDMGWKCRFVPREASFGNGELRRALVNKFQRACKPTDYIICADGDEIQKWRVSPQEIAMNGAEIVLGRRIDRYNETLVGIEHDMDLETNFPFEHENLSNVIYPKGRRTREKIVMAKAHIPVDYKNCSGLLGKHPGNFKVTGDVSILHFKWRDNIFRRLRERSDHSPDEIKAIQNFFK